MAYDLSEVKVKDGQNWSSPKEIHKISTDYYLYAPVGASGGLAIKDGVPYYVTLTWSGEIPTITLGDTLAQIGTNKSSISSLQESVNDKANINHTHSTLDVTGLGTLSSPTQITHPGWYSFGSIGGNLLSLWKGGNCEDYRAACFNFNGSNAGCNFGNLLITSPRAVGIWYVTIWAGAFSNVLLINGGSDDGNSLTYNAWDTGSNRGLKLAVGPFYLQATNAAMTLRWSSDNSVIKTW